MLDLPLYITAFVTLFVVIDPIGMAPMFIALTRGMDAAQRRSIALRSCAIAVGLLTLFGVFGEAVLGFAGISMSAFRIAGGILLFLTALEMLFEKRTQRREGHIAEQNDPSVFPLAIPLIAGPGAITSMILLTGQQSDWVGVLGIHIVMLLVVGVVLTLFFIAGLLERLLGHTGINVVTRLLGMLLAALSVQFVLDGLSGFGIGAAAG